MSKLKLMLFNMVKPLVLSHLSDLGMLSPKLSQVIVDKSHLPQDQADALAAALVAAIETELAVLINKI